MKNQIEIVKDIADGMIGIGGIPSKLISYNKRINTTISRYNPTLTSIKTDNDGREVEALRRQTSRSSSRDKLLT